MNPWGIGLLLFGWSAAMYLTGYYMAKHYWHERGYMDGQEAADRYVRDRVRAAMAAQPRLGRVNRE